MIIWIHDALPTTFVVGPINADPAAFDPRIQVVDRLTADLVGTDDFALLPSAELSLLTATHVGHNRFAIVSEKTGASALLTPVRPDGIEETPITLADVSGTTELLARALLWPYFGIKSTAWSTEQSADAQVTVVEGEPALTEPEIGVLSDLVTAWFVLNEMPVVTYVLAVPQAASKEETLEVEKTFWTALEAGLEQARETRREIRERSDVDPQRLVDFFVNQRYDLREGDQDALRALIYRGSGGSRFAKGFPVRFLPTENGDDD